VIKIPAQKAVPKPRKFKSKLTIEDLEKAGLQPSDLSALQDDWGKLIALMNVLMISGPKITKKIEVKELNKYQEQLLPLFL